jgi:hypothetical protein
MNLALPISVIAVDVEIYAHAKRDILMLSEKVYPSKSRIHIENEFQSNVCFYNLDYTEKVFYTDIRLGN